MMNFYHQKMVINMKITLHFNFLIFILRGGMEIIDIKFTILKNEVFNMTINTDKKFLTVAEVAELFCCDVHQIYKVINSGELRSIKLGRTMIATEWLEDFINTQANRFNAKENGVM